MTTGDDSREAAHGTTHSVVQQSKDCSAQLHIDVEVRSLLDRWGEDSLKMVLARALL